MKKVIILFLFVLGVLQAMAQDRTLHLICDQVLEDSLECRFTLGANWEYTSKHYYPAVYNVDKTSCYFTFPDSIFQRFSAFNLVKRSIPTTRFGLAVINEVDTIAVSGMLFWEETDTLTLKLKFKNKLEHKTMVNHLYLVNYIIENPSPEVALSLYCYHSEGKNEGEPEQLYNYYKRLITQHPDSRSVLCRLYANFRLLTIEQLIELKSLFSEHLLQTYWGKKFTSLIDSEKGKFKNFAFINSRTGEKEKVVIDSQKYTFVIFSASWCAPCHKLIPVLKETYLKKKDVVDFVYISLDEQNTHKAWTQFLDKEQIPWRALSVEDVTKLRQDYIVPVIPYSYLVSPSGSFQRLDIRNDEDLKKLENIQL